MDRRVVTTEAADMTGELPCHSCGYDLRAHPADGTCPECDASVAEARRLAAVPLRPAWRDSDPRWRRRVLAGVWILVCLPLVDVLLLSGVAARVHMPSLFGFPDANDTLAQNTLLFNRRLDQPLLFCIGVVLLFAAERGRRRERLDWTRRWGVICTYVVALLSATYKLFVIALVAVGVGALFMSMPRRYQPGMTPWLIDLSAAYLRHVREPSPVSYGVLVAFSSIAILLACAPLYDALRSSGPRTLALILLAPLVLCSLLNLAHAAPYCLGKATLNWGDVTYEWYFQTKLLTTNATGLFDLRDWTTLPIGFFIEAVKWCIMLTIALWLTVARWAPRRWGKRVATTNPLAREESACLRT